MRISVVLALAVFACGDNYRSSGVYEPEPPDAGFVDPPPTPTYHRDIQPLLARHCTTCHRDGGIAPFALTSLEAAREKSGAIAAFTGARIMPPWPADASGDCNTFVDARWLSDAEIATLAAWEAAGTPEGSPTAPRFAPAPSFTPFAAAVAVGSDTAYQVMPGPDEYRCFVVDPQLASDRYITAIAMELERADLVHHMGLYAADDDTDEQMILQRDADDPGPGYACDQEGVGSGLRYVGSWGAGDLVRRWPDDTGILVRAGRRLVLQFHYHNHGSHPVVDQSRVALELADTVEHVGRIRTASAYPLTLPPGQPDIAATGVTDLLVVQSGMLRAARLHMHTLGTRARLELIRDNQASCVLDIPRWDFGWQLFYRFAQPIALQPSDQIRITCHYDTTSRSSTTTFGVRTEDEMCLGFSYVTD